VIAGVAPLQSDSSLKVSIDNLCSFPPPQSHVAEGGPSGDRLLGLLNRGAGWGGEFLFGKCSHFVSGGILDALAFRSEAVDGWWIRGFEKSSGIGSSPFAVNALRVVDPNRWRSCNLRYSRKTVTIKGVLSIWRKHNNYLVAYQSGEEVLKWFEEHGFDIGHLMRNRLAHALNGNWTTWICSSDFQVLTTISERSTYVRSVYAAVARARAGDPAVMVTALDLMVIDRSPPPGPGGPWHEFVAHGPGAVGAGSGNQADGAEATWSISNADRNR